MIKISRKNLEILVKKHYEGVLPRIQNNLSTCTDEISDPKLLKLLNFTKRIVESEPNIITAKPYKLLELNSSFYRTGEQLDISVDKSHKILKSIFRYENFSRKSRSPQTWDAYSLTRALGINVCPYCNYNYIYTVDNSTRAHLDHFLDQKRFPLLSLSFFNLIPCCQTCNSDLKGSKEFDLQNFLHPYLEGFGDNGSFDFEYADNLTNLKVRLRYKTRGIDSTSIKKKIENNVKTFKILERYDKLQDVIKEINFKKRVYNSRYLHFLATEYLDIKKPEEIYQYVFANYFHQDNFEKRPFSKLTKDLFNKL